MKFILLEWAFVFLAILEELSALAIEHTVVPGAFVLNVTPVSVQNPIAALDAISELAFVPASVSPPERAPSIALALHKLPFVEVGLFACPLI